MNRIKPLMLCVFCLGAAAQEIVIDWPSRSVVSCPASAGSRSTITVRVQNVNDVLYSYDVQAKVTTLAPDDWALFGAAVQPAKAPENAGCDQKIAGAVSLAEQARQDFAGDPSLTPAAKDGKYPSVPIGDTMASWKVFAAAGGHYANLLDQLKKIDDQGCQPSEGLGPPLEQARKLVTTWRTFERRLTLMPHNATKVVPLQVGADSEVVVTVSEHFTDTHGTTQTTTNGEKTFEKCSLSADVLYLSLGPLFSSIPNRKYTKQQIYPILPVTDANGKPVLGADGKPKFQTSSDYYNALVATGSNRLNTVGAALLNYRFPWANRNWLSLSASAGPTFRFSGQEQKSSRIGFFTGISLGLWRRLYFTPGVHVGEFADYPAGLVPGSAVPSGYPDAQLDGVPRWTAKFGIAVSFQTKSFANLDIGLLKAKTPAPAGTDSGGGSGDSPGTDTESKGAKNTAAPSNGSPATPAAAKNAGAGTSAASPGAGFTPADSGPAATPAGPSTDGGGSPTPAKTGASKTPAAPGAAPATATPAPGPAPAPTGATDVTPPPGVQLGRPTFDGSACAAGATLPSYALSPDKAVLSVLWDGFELRSDKAAPGKPMRSDCQVQAPVSVPVGKRIAIVGADIRRAADLGAGDSITFRATLSLHGAKDGTMNTPSSLVRTGPAEGDFVFSPHSTRPHWSACGGPATLVFRVDVSAKPPISGLARVGSIDSLDFDTKNSKHLLVEDCGGN